MSNKRYTEPNNYFSSEIRKKYGLGEYAPKTDNKKSTTKKTVKKPKRK